VPTIPAHDREPLLAEAFVRLADSLVDEFAVVEMLDELARYCLDFLGVDAAGLLLTDRRDHLHVVAASTEQSHLVELFAIQAVEGPSLDCYRSGHPVLVPDLSKQSITRRWPRFVEHATSYGFHAVHSLPLRLRATAIGALTLFAAAPTALSPSALRVGQALADTATIAILQARSIDNHNEVADQLQRALTSRLVIEQAKARLAERRGIPLDEAFHLMRSFARNHNLRLSELASAISTNTETHALLRFEASADHSTRTTKRGRLVLPR
jgi:transcriptional regulator with GAF, ATPase, and Fis domain